ncbi:MAG: hypothetical protein IKA01_00360 [Alistipes sp.]|nr:hypothetical protein [Alistipes sp.]
MYWNIPAPGKSYRLSKNLKREYNIVYLSFSCVFIYIVVITKERSDCGNLLRSGLKEINPSLTAIHCYGSAKSTSTRFSRLNRSVATSD